MARKNNGLASLQSRLSRIPIEVRKAIQPAVNKSADEMANQMRNLAPVDEGDLRDSITVTTAGNTTPAYSQPGGSMAVPEGAAVITVGNTDVRYPHLVEFGTEDTNAQPFFFPAVRLVGPRAQRRIKRALGKAVRDGWEGT